MSLDPTIEVLGHSNLKTVAENSAVQMAFKQSDQVQHGKRSDSYAELSHQNAISNQQLAQQSALDELNNSRNLNRMFMGALAEKLIVNSPTDAVATSAMLKGNSDAGLMSNLSALAAGSLANKGVAISPPETGVVGAMAQLNSLNSTQASNNSLVATIPEILSNISREKKTA